MEGEAAPGATRGRVPFPSHWIGNCVAAGEWVAPWDGRWEAGRESSCCRVGGWVGARYVEGIPEAGTFEE